MTAIETGAMAPDFELPGDRGTIRLSALRGRPVVIFFFPKADAGTCATEAQDFTRLVPQFAEAGVALIGISPDPVKKQVRFRSKFGLDVDLASDESRATLEAYGVWTLKTMYGRDYMGVERTTLLIGPDGRIIRIWPKVRIAGHAEAVLEAAKAL